MQELSLQREPERAVVPLVFLCRLCTVALCVLGCWGGEGGAKKNADEL